MENVRCMLEEFCRNSGAKLIDFTFINDFNFKCELRIHHEESGNANEFCEKLVSDFGDITTTNWIVRYTYPNAERLKFRKVYVCQHSDFGKVKNRKRDDTRTRNKKCPAKIDIKIKLTNRHTMRRDSFLKDGLNTIFTITFKHSHRVRVAEAYSYLRMTQDTKDKFLQYFDDGMGPTCAKTFHEMFLMETDKFQEKLANAKLNPTDRQIRNLYDQWRTVNFGTRSGNSIADVIKKKKHLYEAKGVEIIIKENPLIIVVLTPIMKRAHSLLFAKEMAFVDSSGSCDQMNTCVTFLYGASKIGAIPLACLLHTAQTESNYALAFSCLKDCLGENCFGGQGYPSVFMTDDSICERNALSSVFPSSRLLLCLFHLAQAFWRWLWTSKNNVLNEDRKPIMRMFQRIIYSANIEEAELYYGELSDDIRVKSNSLLLNHINGVWDRRVEWCLCLRSDAITRGNNTNNYVEASIRIFKDIVLQRCKAFNSCALVDFIANIFENYHEKHLLEFANSRRSKPKLNYLAFVKKAKNLDVHKIDDNTYRISSSDEKNLFYTACVDLALCDCPFGQGGRFCKHLCAIQEQYSLVIHTSPVLNPNDRVAFAQIALGNEASAEFYGEMEVEKTNDMNGSSENMSPVQDLLPEVISEHDTDSWQSSKQQVNFTQGPTDPLHEREVERLSTNFQRITQIARENPNPDLSNILHKMNNYLDTLTTATQVQTYFSELGKGKNRNSRNICVQPTSKSRRKIRPGLTSGSKRVQSGRPSNKERKVANKKKRNLSSNVNLNATNAKSHGTAH